MTPRILGLQLDLGGAARRARLRAAVTTVLGTLEAPAQEGLRSADLLSRLEAVLADGRPDHLWLALAVVSGRLPVPEEVVRAARTAQLDGPLKALAGALVTGGRRPVRVLTGEVVVDLHHTAQTTLTTGIQRVARETSARWDRDHAPRFVRWDPSLRSLHELTGPEREAALTGSATAPEPAEDAEAVVPWRCTLLLPELAQEPARTRRLRGLISYSAVRSGLIGFDCVPVTSAETAHAGMGATFAGMLSAAARSDVVAAISEAAAAEYRGWRAMLSGTGLDGPEVVAVRLPTETRPPSAEAVDRARDLVLTGDLPMVLCVGSHEPRKNHLAVLHAAEQLWQQQLAFSLVLVGGNSWRSQAFNAEAERLIALGRPLRLLRGLDDEVLIGAYGLARFSVFPSLNEGFGLPVAESLSLGTPVVTSGFGSMQEIADDGGGALLVDPRSDTSLLSAMRSLLLDDDLLARLVAEARARPVSTWDDYAARAWDVLLGD